MGKARRRTDTMDVIKHSQKLTKKAAGMKRQLASGTAYTHRSAMAATKTLGSSAGGGPTSGTGDLEMHTFDIKDVDRLYFAVTKGSSDTLESQSTGIEAASYYDGDTDTQYTFGLNFQIPGTVTGLAYYFKIGTTQPFAIQLNSSGGADIKIVSTSSAESVLRFDGDGSDAAIAGSEVASIYFDGTDILAKVDAGTVNLTSGGSGPTLGGTNSWTGANTFTTYVVMPGSSSSMPASTFEGASDGYFRIKHGASIKNVPYWDE